MSDIDEIEHLLRLCTPAQRHEIFQQLRQEFTIHPLEQELHARAEIILGAIQRAGGLTLRMIRGVIAESAFDVEVVERLKNWESLPVTGDPAYDFVLKDRQGEVRLQVKLQRTKSGQPWLAHQARKAFRSLPPDMFVVETQKTRGGKTKQTGAATRPYRFGEFDLLAVATYPSTKRWDAFMYTVADWLIPDPNDPKLIFRYQPVASTANEDWTDQFQTAVKWLRSGQKKTIRAQ
ncbi:MAG: hypothetical protein JNM56_21075 [Planctomycetia bacterium]|nr:hypothetical protein [Planctomycetia bacterium]